MWSSWWSKSLPPLWLKKQPKSFLLLLFNYLFSPKMGNSLHPLHFQICKLEKSLFFLCNSLSVGNLSLLRESKQFTYIKQKLPFPVINTISKHVPFWGIPMIIDNQWQSSGNSMYEDMGSSYLMPWLSKWMCKSRDVRKAFHNHTHFQIIFHVANLFSICVQILKILLLACKSVSKNIQPYFIFLVPYLEKFKCL